MGEKRMPLPEMHWYLIKLNFYKEKRGINIDIRTSNQRNI